MKVDDDRDDFDGDSMPPASDPLRDAPLQRRLDTIQDQLAAPQILRVRQPGEIAQTERVWSDVN